MRFKLIAISGIALIMLGMSCFSANDASAQVPLVSKEELKGMLCKMDVIVIDVRQPGQWDGSESKITCALREDPGKKTESWAVKYPKDKTIVLY